MPITTASGSLGPRQRRAALVALAGGILVFLFKGLGWWLTGSEALFSDALESTVNIAAASFAVFSVRYAAKPADRDHPYGHGKIEFVAAAFEGGLITFAAGLIFYRAIRSLVEGPELQQLGLGLGVAAISAAFNTGLGWWVLREGRATESATLIADGKHILSDVWTTLGVLGGLAAVRLTGWVWLDPIAALLVGLLLARTGVGLVREAVDALLDKEDPELLERLVRAFNEAPVEGITGVHRLRAIRSGNLVHVDAHVFVPGHWTVAQAHAAVERIEAWMLEKSHFRGELALHLDPCEQSVCSRCDLPACPFRKEPYGGTKEVALEDAVSPTGLPQAP